MATEVIQQMFLVGKWVDITLKEICTYQKTLSSWKQENVQNVLVYDLINNDDKIKQNSYLIYDISECYHFAYLVCKWYR